MSRESDQEDKAMVRRVNKSAWSLVLTVSAQRAETSVSADHGVSASGEDAAEVNPGFSSASKIVNTVNLFLCVHNCRALVRLGRGFLCLARLVFG